MDFVLTPDQQKALDYIEDWLLNSDEPVCLLYGSAGTGKTALLKSVFDMIEEQMRKRYPFLKVTAPTHIAKNIVREATGRSATTVTKYLQLVPDNTSTDFDINNPQFIEKANANPSAVSVLGSDEASMIKAWEFEKIYNKARQTNTKVLFIGDICQISPVGEEESVVFRKCKKRVGLFQLVRQEITNPIVIPILGLRHDVLHELHKKLSKEWKEGKHLLDAVEKSNLETFIYDVDLEKQSLRQQISKEMDKYGLPISKEADLFKQIMLLMPRQSQVGDGSKGYRLLRDEDTFIDEMINDFAKGDLFNDDVTTLAFSNHKVKYYNKAVRDSLFPHSLDLTRGDLMMGYKNIKHGHLKVLVNSETYVIDAAEKETRRGIRGTSILLRSKGSNMFRKNLFVVDNDEENLVRFLVLHEKYRTVGNMHDYLQFKDGFLLTISLTEEYKKRQLPMGTRHILKKNLPKKDIDFAYARTFHKSQGGTFKTVYVDARSALFILYKGDHKKLEFYRLLYVALSRAKEYVSILF